MARNDLIKVLRYMLNKSIYGSKQEEILAEYLYWADHETYREKLENWDNHEK